MYGSLRDQVATYQIVHVGTLIFVGISRLALARSSQAKEQRRCPTNPRRERLYRALSRPPGDLDFVGELEVRGRPSAISGVAAWVVSVSRMMFLEITS